LINIRSTTTWTTAVIGMAIKTPRTPYTVSREGLGQLPLETVEPLVGPPA
jgi:hypothetical protein